MTGITFYNMWRTETPESRSALLARMKDEAPALASKVGFVSMTVLECAEDGRVLVEGRWQSQMTADQGRCRRSGGPRIACFSCAVWFARARLVHRSVPCFADG